VIEAKRLLILADRQNTVFDGHILAGEHKIDAGVRRGTRNVDAANVRVRVRRAKHFAMRHAGKGNVVRETGLSRDFGASVHPAAGVANYAQFAIISVGLLA
jgi:hypothetical protein